MRAWAQSLYALVFRAELIGNQSFENRHQWFGIDALRDDLCLLQFLYQIVASFDCGNAFGARLMLERENRRIIFRERKFRKREQKFVVLYDFS